MAPPKKSIDEARLENLAANFCTAEEMAADQDVNVNLLHDRPGFQDLIEKGRNKGKLSLRATQFRTAMGMPGQEAVYLREHQTEDGKQYGPIVRDKNGNAVKLKTEIKHKPPSETMQIWLGKQHLGQSDKFTLPDERFEGFSFSYKDKKAE